jgi:hypothetical protein
MNRTFSKSKLELHTVRKTGNVKALLQMVMLCLDSVNVDRSTSGVNTPKKILHGAHVHIKM